MADLLMPAWPEETHGVRLTREHCSPNQAERYERALAAAYAPRLLAAVEALQEIAQGFWVDASGGVHTLNEEGKFHHALDCVALIGELPKLPTGTGE